MTDILRPPSSEEGEISDESEGKAYVPKSPDYVPKSPILPPDSPKQESQKKQGKHEKKDVISGSEHSDTEFKKRKHHKSHKEKKHHKHHDKDKDKEKETAPAMDQETFLRNKLLQNQKNRDSKERTDKEKEDKDRKRRDESSYRDKERRKEEKDEKREKKHSESTDEDEHFAIQPKDQVKSKSVREDRNERDRYARERERERDTRDRRARDDHRNRGVPDRHRDREDREGRSRQKHEDREDRGKRERSDVRDRDRKKDKEREHREKREKDDRKLSMKRSRTRSISTERSLKRERKSSTPLKEEKRDVTDDEMRSGGSTPTRQEQSMDVPEENAELSKQRRPGYSKFDSDSEHESEHEDQQGDNTMSPERSPTPLRESEPEEEPFDPSLIPFDELTDEQKAKIPEDELLQLGKRWQKSLINALPVYYAGVKGCRNVIEYDCMNRIEEGTFGVVYRAKDKRTEEIVALKGLKMDKEKDGFPITSLREINMLLKAGGHENVVKVKEIVVGSNMDKIFLVMEFVEHDMKSLMDIMHTRGKSFAIGEVKTLMQQLLRGVEYMHDLWILHRDLKTSNLLLNHQGVLKIADFGLAREYGNPLGKYTQVVVTLWYRSPELLLGDKMYSTPIDMWSVGCIMGEFIRLKPLFPGRGEIDQINKIFHELGVPKLDHWPELADLPLWKNTKFDSNQYNQIRKHFPAAVLNESGFDLLNRLLTYNPQKRFSADDALKHRWFREAPLPTARELFPTFPAKSEQGRPPPQAERPQPKDKHSRLSADMDAKTAELFNTFKVVPPKQTGSFSLKFDSNRF